MADISALGGLNPVEPLDLDIYPDAKDRKFELPKAGRYSLQAPSEFPSSAFGRTKKGALSVTVDPKIVGPAAEGYQIRYISVTNTTFVREAGKKASTLGDYLRSCGLRGSFKDEQEQADAVEQTMNAVYLADIDWRAFNKESQTEIRGMEKFPSDGNGGFLPWVEGKENQIGDDGQPVLDRDGNPRKIRYYARLYVKRFVPQETV